eukprot:TRINITY_DN340_c0_g1_i11.p1 TRINITY_DN340_c0_g1~~TRINITY_DN340_c0_g1_i11.p1  ORF type:complete len:105 (+),score=10.23 TRINITY_DN340_c0_g1_i11:252-566(+)
MGTCTNLGTQFSRIQALTPVLDVSNGVGFQEVSYFLGRFKAHYLDLAASLQKKSLEVCQTLNKVWSLDMSKYHRKPSDKVLIHSFNWKKPGGRIPMTNFGVTLP